MGDDADPSPTAVEEEGRPRRESDSECVEKEDLPDKAFKAPGVPDLSKKVVLRSQVVLEEGTTVVV